MPVGLFGKKKTAKRSFDRSKQRPVIRCSICTGEQVAGFRDTSTGKFTDIMLIRSDSDLDRFREMYEIDGEIAKEY